MLSTEQNDPLKQLKLVTGLSNTEDVFKKLYYFLYSNGSSSKASTILNDIIKVMLALLYCQREGIEPTRLDGEEIEGINNIAYEWFAAKGISGKPSADNKTLSKIIEILSPIDLTSISSHELGSLYQALIGPRARGEKGQFFTQRNLCRSLVKLCNVKDGDRILDPACGTGGFLTETVSYLAENKINSEIIGIEKDEDIFLIAQLAQQLLNNKFAVHLMDSLDHYQKKDGLLLKESYDVIITNPPFGSKIKVADMNILEKFLFSREWVEYEKGFMPTNTIRPTDPQMLFFELCLSLLKEGGRLAIVLPEGMFGNKSSRFAWEYLQDSCSLDFLIDCPRATFQPGTDTKTNCLVATKRHSEEKSVNHCKVFVANHCGHNKRGKSTDNLGNSLPDDFLDIAKDGAKHKGWQKIAKLRADYFVPRYYYTSQKDVLANGFAEYTFGELIRKKWMTVNKGVEVGSDTYGSGQIPFIRTSDIANLDCSADPSFSISHEIFSQIPAKNKPEDGDILLVVDGRYRIGANAVVFNDSIPIAVQSHIKIIRIKKNPVFDKIDLILALNSDFTREEFKRITFIQSTIGTVVPLLDELRVRFGTDSSQWQERKANLSKAFEARNIYKSTVREVLGRGSSGDSLEEEIEISA